MPPVVIATANVREGFLCQLIPWGRTFPLGGRSTNLVAQSADDRRLQTTDRS